MPYPYWHRGRSQYRRDTKPRAPSELDRVLGQRMQAKLDGRQFVPDLCLECLRMVQNADLWPDDVDDDLLRHNVCPQSRSIFLAAGW